MRARRGHLAVALGLLVAAQACSTATPRAMCEDFDSDGYGPGCAKGPDCDDSDPDRSLADECSDGGVQQPSACELHPVTQDCPCLRSDPGQCYGAAPETQGVGQCKAGKATCEDGGWSVCEGEQLPGIERCNAIDDDCDGFVDEGVQSPCGGCNPECTGGVWGPPAAPFDVEPPLAVSAAGELTLQRTPRDALTLWIPNTDEGSVSKLDVRSAREVARYRTRGRYPTRVAVDHRGDAWVLDASPTADAYLTKLAGTSERCRDRNGDGLRTSQSATDVLPLGADECVLLELPLAAATDQARALALDGEVAPDSERAGNVWIGMAGTQRLIALDGESGTQLVSLALPDFGPQAGAFDSDGVLWLIDRAGWLARVEPRGDLPTPELSVLTVPFACYALDALSIDTSGALLLSGSSCESLFSYDPRRKVWRSALVPGLLSPRNVIALPDASWVVYTSGQLGSIPHDDAALAVSSPHELASDGTRPYETIAVSADTLGQLWTLSTQGGPAGSGVVTRFDPKTARVTAQVPVGMGPRGSGDLTGFALAGDFAPQGAATHVFRGCGREGRSDQSLGSDAGTQWGSLHIEALAGASASLEVAVRRADDESALADVAFQVLGELRASRGVLPAQLAPGGVVEVRLVLRSPAAIGAPRVARVGLEWSCPGPD